MQGLSCAINSPYSGSLTPIKHYKRERRVKIVGCHFVHYNDGMPNSRPLLDKNLYHSVEHFNLEKERIFYSTWQLAGHRSQLANPGDYVCLHIADQHVFVICGEDHEIRAFYNVCQHRGHELLQGSGNTSKTILCGYHAWAYGTEGQLKSARNTANTEAFNKCDFALEPVRIEQALGFVFVNLDNDANSLQDSAGEMFEDIKKHVPHVDELAVSDKYETEGPDLEANWKILAENCLECYHCAPSHPAFCDFIDMQSYRATAHGAWLRSYGELGKADNKAYPVEPNEPSQKAIYWHLWPNTELIIYPGEAAMTTFRFHPKTEKLTGTSSLMLLKPGESIAQERIDYRWNTLWPEDRAICLSVQKGLQSRGYRGGTLVVNEEQHAVSEHAVAAFQDLYRQWMSISGTVS